MGERVYNSWLKTVADSPGKAVIRDAADRSNASFSQIQEEVERRTSMLDGIGPVRNRVIAFQLQNSPHWLATFLACQARDAIAMPVDPDVPGNELESISARVHATAVWTDKGLRRLNNGSVRQPACLVKLTSGSTGDPRPLLFEDDQMLADGYNIMRTMGIKATDSNLATIPFGHSYGLGNLIMPCIMRGCAMHICHDPFPHAIAAAVAEMQTTVYPTVPAIIKALIRSSMDAHDLQSIRLWISAGSRLDAGVAVKFKQRFNRPIHNFYGSSETGGIAYDRSGRDTQTGRSVGKPLEGVKVSISPARRLLVESHAVFTRNNVHRKGPCGTYMLPDVATIMDDGSIRLEGRKARIVKLAGKRLSLAEVEKALLGLDGIEAAFVDEYTDSTGRTRIGSVLVSSLSQTTINARLKTTLAPWKIPTRWIFAKELPANSRGKLARSKLQEMIRSGSVTPEKR